MVVKVYVSRCSGNIEMKTKQDFIVRILESRKIIFEQIDISDQSQENEKAFMRKHSTVKEGQKVALPPQIFFDEQYCGDYDGFLDANEDDALYEFLKLAPEKKVSVAEIKFTEQSAEKKDDPLDDIIEAAAVDSEEKHDAKKDDNASSQSEQDSGIKDSDNKIVVCDSMRCEREDSASLHDYENVVLTQDGDGNTVVDVKEVVDIKEEADSGSLHDYENVVLTRDGEGNTVVQLRKPGEEEEEGKERKAAPGENGAAAGTEVTSGGD